MVSKYIYVVRLRIYEYGTGYILINNVCIQINNAMNVFLSSVDTGVIIETRYVGGDIFEGTVELNILSSGETMEGSFVFTETLLFTQKLGGYNTRDFDIRAMIPVICTSGSEPIAECLAREQL